MMQFCDRLSQLLTKQAMVATTVCSAIGTAHWEIGKLLHDKKIESKHGSGVVNRLSFDLKQRYPQMGVSPRNLWDMKKFYERFCESEPKLRQAVAVLPWGHTLTLRRKFGEDDNAILYYAQETTSKGWNRELLTSSNKFNRILFGTLSIAFLLFFVYNWWVVSSMPYKRFLYIGLGLLVYICEYMYLKAIQNDL